MSIWILVGGKRRLLFNGLGELYQNATVFGLENDLASRGLSHF